MPLKPSTSAKPRVAGRRASESFALKMDITIPARLTAISPLVDSVMTLVHRHAHAQTKEMEIETALREALANAVKHGCQGDPAKFVQCSVVFEEDDSLLIVVRDPGPGFNPKLLPDPTDGEHRLRGHGRGIYLIHHLMDEVRFRRHGSEIQMRSRF